MRKFLLFIVAALFSATMSGQDAPANMPRRAPQAAPKRLTKPSTHWDASRTYPQIVVLLEFADTTFSMPDPKEFYNKLFNEPGYNGSAGPGCAAEYMLAQSLGVFHIRFDIYGPYRITQPAKKDIEKNYGNPEKKEALDSLFAAEPDLDYRIYDWDGDNVIEQVVYVCAGPNANEGHTGFIWPNTSIAPMNMKTPDGLGILSHSITPETTHTSSIHRGASGFGTMMHEYSHALGLPDVYPTAGNNVNTVFSVADTWDLMDGGNFINYGWCPPNYTAYERMYMNWLTPVELDVDTVITGMKPVADGGSAYLIRHTENEYLLLENRQQTGWDYGAPGRGLTIWHVDYDATAWENNTVNNSENLRLGLYYADNMDFVTWREHAGNHVIGLSPRLRWRWLSTAAYPWQTDSTDFVNRELSEESTPALVMYNKNAAGSYNLGKRIKDIQMAEDGTISFHLEVDAPTRVEAVSNQQSAVSAEKVLRNGQLLVVLPDGKTYTVTGVALE